MAMNKLLVLAAIAEAATGVALLIVPSLVGRVLLGEELGGVSVLVARVAGFALIGFAVACWPGKALIGMSMYSGAIALFFAYLGIAGANAGPLLWPAAIVHAILTALLIRTMWTRS